MKKHENEATKKHDCHDWYMNGCQVAKLPVQKAVIKTLRFREAVKTAKKNGKLWEVVCRKKGDVFQLCINIAADHGRNTKRTKVQF